MRNICVLSLAALLAAGPAMGQVVIQTPSFPQGPTFPQGPNPEAQRDQHRAMQDRADARWENQEAQRRAAMGDYQGAAEAQRDARRDWQDSRREQERSRDDSQGIVIGH